MGTNLGGLSETFNKVPEAARGPLTDIVGSKMEALTPIMEKAMSLPGVGDILKPAMGPIMEMLNGMGG